MLDVMQRNCISLCQGAILHDFAQVVDEACSGYNGVVEMVDDMLSRFGASRDHKKAPRQKLIFMILI